MWNAMDWNVVLMFPVLLILLGIANFLLGAPVKPVEAEKEDSSAAPSPTGKVVAGKTPKALSAALPSEMAQFAGGADHLQPEWKAPVAAAAEVAEVPTVRDDSAEKEAARARSRATIAMLAARGLGGGSKSQPPAQVRQIPLALEETPVRMEAALVGAAAVVPVVVDNRMAEANLLLATAMDADDLDGPGMEDDLGDWDREPGDQLVASTGMTGSENMSASGG